MGEITQRYAPSVLQAELLKAIAQRVPGDAEALSGLGLVSGRLAHRSLDHRLFPLSEVDALRRQRGRASARLRRRHGDRKSTCLNSSHSQISYAVFCLKKKKNTQ